MRKVIIFILLFSSLQFLPLYAQKGDLYKGYRGYVDLAVGAAYNLNTAQTISTNNIQWYTEISTTHGYVVKNWFVGVGAGYYHSFRDKENIYPFYLAGRYTFEGTKIKPYIDVRGGMAYDPYWISKVQAYGALCAGFKVFKGLQVGLRATVFSRPSRYFTANASVVIGYAFGK